MALFYSLPLVISALQRSPLFYPADPKNSNTYHLTSMFSLLSSCGGPEADACDASPPMLPVLFSAAPFLLTGTVLAILFNKHLFTVLSGETDSSDDSYHSPLLLVLPTHTSFSASPSSTVKKAGRCAPIPPLPRIAFASLLALTCVLVEVILADMCGLVGPRARDAVLAFVVPSLLGLLVVGAPLLEIRAVVAGEDKADGAGGFATTAAATPGNDSSKNPRRNVAGMLLAGAFCAWLFLFWSVGSLASTPTTTTHGDPLPPDVGLVDRLTRACLTRVGVVGIALMALLSGFASVSTPWHLIISSFFRRNQPLTTVANISRKQAGLQSTTGMLLDKRARLQALERKASASSNVHSSSAARTSPGIVGKMMGTIKHLASGDEMERRSLRIEIAALETVEANLASALNTLRNQYESHLRAATPLGRMLTMPTYVFAVYCIYRVVVTCFSTLRRLVLAPSLPSDAAPTFSSADPVSRFLGLLARHWDPSLDQLAWARQISFLLSGAILFASASSAMQTIRLFGRLAPSSALVPGLLRHARANGALLAAQVAATYVISAALLLRGSLPREVVQGGAVGGVLRGVLEPAWIERWFEGWFLTAGLATAVAIWIGRKLEGAVDSDTDGWDSFEGEEGDLGEKRS